MTQRSTPNDSLGQLGEAELDETLRKAQAIYILLLEEVVRLSSILWPELKSSKIGVLELHQVALQQHLDNGGDPEEDPSPLAINRAMKVLEATAVHIKYQTAATLIDARFGEYVERLLPLLSAKEQTERRITFARAVMITTGNHDRKNERPSRWIPRFQARAAKHGEESAKAALGSLTTDNLKGITAIGGTVFNIYAGYGPDDSLALNEFARMFGIFAYEFPRGKELIGRLGGVKLPRFTAEQAQALKKLKKVLGPDSGQPQKSAPSKLKKQRTKSA